MQSIVENLNTRLTKKISDYKEWSSCKDHAEEQIKKLGEIKEKIPECKTIKEIAELGYDIREDLLDILINKFEELDSIGIFEAVVSQRKRKRCMILT